MANQLDGGENILRTGTAAPIVEVANRKGGWVSGYELLSFNSDGTVSIRSSHTGKVRCLPQGQWRDPLEVAALGELARGK